MTFQSFRTDAERSAWIQANAELYTIIRFKGADSPSRYDRAEVPSLEEARFVARCALEKDPSARLVIYAVSGVQSCYVETIKGS